MGIQVDFGPELGLVDFGDMPEEQVRATIREQGPQLRANLISRRQQELEAEPVPEFVSEEASNRGRVTSAGQSVMRGGGEASGRTVSGLARVLEAFGPYLSAGSDNEQVADIGLQEIERRRGITPTQREAEIQQDPLYQAGQEITSGAREAYQPNPAYAGEFITDVLPSSAGGMVPTIASSIAGGPMGSLLAALQYGSSAGQSAAEEAIAAGRPDLAQQAFAVNAPIGAVTEGVLGAAANIGRLRDLGGRSAAATIGRTALSEVGQEGLEQVGGNLAARGVGYDPNRGVFEGVPESMLAGAVLGGGMGGAAVGVDRLGQRLSQPDFSLTPLPQDANPLTPPPEWFNRQAQVQEAASVAIATLDQQIAQANPVSPLEANTLVADNAAKKMEVLAKYLEAQRAVAQQAQPSPEASALAALEARQAATFPAAPMAQAPEPTPRLLSPAVIDQLRNARLNDAAQQAGQALESAVPPEQTQFPAAPRAEAPQQFGLSPDLMERLRAARQADVAAQQPQPTVPNAIQEQEAGPGMLGSEAIQPQQQVGLPEVGQGNPQVPVAGQQEAQAPVAKKRGRKPATQKEPPPPKEYVEPEEKVNIPLRQAQWASDPVIADLGNLTPQEAVRVVAEAEGKASEAPATTRTELIRFMREVRSWIESGSGGKAPDLVAAEFQADRERLFDAIMRDAVRFREKDTKDGVWQFNRAWKRATSGSRSVASRELTEIRKTKAFKAKKTQAPAESTTEDGDIINVADNAAAAVASQQETQAKSAQLNSELKAFVQENDLDEDEATALLIRVARERNSAQLTEEMLDSIDPDRRLESMSRTDMMEGYFQKLLPSIRDILYSLNGPVLIPITQADAQAAITEAFGELPNVRVINDPNAVAPNGESAVGAAAFVDLSTGQITVNTAFIESRDRAVMGVLEEGVHIVFKDPELQAQWAAVQARIDQAKIDAQIARGYSPEVAREEAAVAEVLDYIEQNRKGGPIGEFLANLWTKLKELLGVGNEYDAQRNQIIQRALQALQNGQPAAQGVRFSRGNGLFLSRAEASEAIGKAQQVGGDVGTIAQAAQIQGELIPRSIVSDVEALGNSTNRVEKLAAAILSPLKSIGDLADQTWLAPFTRFNPSARMASDGGSAAEIAAEAVVRADLAIRAKQRSVKEKLVRAEAALMEAIDNLPKAVVADSDATMNRIEGDALIEQMDMALANELKVARSADVPDALAEAAIIRASRALGEARKDIGSGIGSALNAIARELPAQLTTKPAILNWIGQRLADKSQPRIMSEAVEQFLTTRLPGSRTIPLQRVELAPLMARLRKLNDIKEQAKTELEQFKKDFHGGATTKAGKGKAVTMRAFAKRFANFQEKYKAALALSRELNAKAARAQDYYDALTIADEKFTEATESISYREKLKDAVEISNAGSGSLKILLGDNGQLNGTISIPNPISKQIEVVDLSPMRFKRLETQAKLNELAKAHEIALGDIETDPYDRVQLARNLSQIRRMQDAGIRAGSYIVDLVPEKVPILGGLSYIPLSRIHHDAPWFGKRLSSPNNVVTWVSGAAGKSVAGIMAATDIAAAQLEKLRSDSNRSKPSQDKINRTTEAAIEAHGLDPQNPENQKLISDHFSTIISQAQRPEQRQFRVGDYNPANDLPVLKEDIEAVEAQKQWGTAVYKVGQQAKPNSIGRNIAERPAQQSEVISGKSITRIAADYGLKMPRQASISTLPVVRDWSTAMNKAQRQQILEDNFELLVVGMVMETDPDFTTRFSNEDREIFAGAIADGRAGNLPFSDVNSFIQWWGSERAAANDTTVAEEVLIAEGKLYSIVDGFMRDFAEYAGVGEKSQMTVEDREKRNTPDSLMTIASADNQFTRPRGKLVAPSTLYSYDVTGIAAQESMKTNLLNVFHYEHIKAWTNVKSALKSAMETWDRRKKEMVGKGMRERDAVRKLQLESRKGSASIRNEADYATLRNTVGHIEAMVAELTRSATERLAVPEDAPVVRSGKSLVGLAGASLLASPGPTINNLTGGAFGSALIGSWLNRTSTLASGAEALRRSTRNSVGRILHAAAGKMGWFDGWLKSNGWAANFFADMVATATYQRQLAEDALTVDSPDTASLVEMRLKLPGSGGVVDPGRSDHLVTWLLNQLQSGMGIPKLKSITPQWMHKTIDMMAKVPVAATEYTKRIAPAAFDREINATTGAMYREWVDNPAIKKALFDHWSRKEALGGSWNDPANPDFQFGRDDLGEILPDQSRKLLADVLAPIGSLERISLDWYNRTKAMTPAARLAEPMLSEDQGNQFAFEMLKLTNQRTESTTPAVMKGKGLSGLIRAIFWQFARYGANQTDVLRRRFAAISGDQDRENRWLAGFLLAATMAFLGAVGLELKGFIKDWIEREPRTTPTIAQASTDPEAALRYAAASIVPFLHPTGTELVQSVVGGQTKSTPFDLSQKVPMLGQATALARAVQTMVQTGDVVYPTVDFIRTAIPITKAAFNLAMPGDAARREAARAVRAAAPGDIELKEFGGGVGGKQTPMTPLIRSAINSAMEGDGEGYREAFDKAVAYQVSRGKTAEEAKKTVESAISAKDPIQSVVGRKLEPVDEARIASRMSSRQRSSFLRARSITSSLRSKRPARRRTSLLRKGRKKAKRTRLL